MGAVSEALPKVCYVVLCHWSFGCLNAPVLFLFLFFSFLLPTAKQFNLINLMNFLAVGLQRERA